jgi:hypothetical protein
MCGAAVGCCAGFRHRRRAGGKSTTSGGEAGAGTVAGGENDLKGKIDSSKVT